jgi:hypothetical protein
MTVATAKMEEGKLKKGRVGEEEQEQFEANKWAKMGEEARAEAAGAG